MSTIITREDYLNAARKKDPTIGDDAMFVAMEWGFWIGSVYVSKKEVRALKCQSPEKESSR